jgi:ABC-type multidrug transport system fused ATPase/permease subunit
LLPAAGGWTQKRSFSMALARGWFTIARAAPAAPGQRWSALRTRLRADLAGIAELVAMTRFFTREFERAGWVLVLLGATIVAWDLFVPIVGARVIDAMAAQRPFEEVALLIVGLALLIWLPHGNLLPYFLDIVDLKRFGVRLQGRIAVRSLRLALLNPANAAGHVNGPRVLGGEHAQPVLVEGRENLGRLALVVIREVPAALRGTCILILLVWMVPMFVPFLLGGAIIDLAITFRMGARLAPRFRARQDAENLQRRLENELLARHFGTGLPEAEVERIVAPFEAAVLDRVAKELAAEIPARAYKLQRDLVFNVTNIASWLVGAWYVLAASNPLGTFLFSIAWSSRANELFTAVMNVQQEIMRSRRSVERLATMIGLERGSILPALSAPFAAVAQPRPAAARPARSAARRPPP